MGCIGEIGVFERLVGTNLVKNVVYFCVRFLCSYPDMMRSVIVSLARYGIQS